MKMMTIKAVVAVLYFMHLLLGAHSIAIASESDGSSSDDETYEASYESDTYSMEELTTISNTNSFTLPVVEEDQETNSPNNLVAKSSLLTKVLSSKSIEMEPLSDETSKNKSFIESGIEIEPEVVNIKKSRLLSTKYSTSSSSSIKVNNNNSGESSLTEKSVEDTTTLMDLELEDNDTNSGGDIVEEITTTANPPLTATTSTFSSSSSSTSKRPPKNIEIFKTKPNELLRFYVEDGHLRSPIAALVDKKPNPLKKAKKLWKVALRPNSLLDIMVVSYDSEGIKSTYNLTNTKAMMQTLDKVKEENITEQESKTYYSIIRTGQLIPFDSAIFLSTDDLPNDTEHQLQASMFLLKKRIRLYLIIFDNKNVSSSTSSESSPQASIKDTGFLGQLAMITGGDIIYVPNYAFDMQPDGEMGYITLIRNKLKAIDQEPFNELFENELRNETDIRQIATDDHHHLETHESITFN